MSTDENGEVPEIEIKDAEDYTDKKVKQRILKSRENIVNGYYELFTKPVANEEMHIDRRAALRSWGDLVRSYLRELSVLLNHDDIPESQHYREEVELGQMQFVPPDKDGYPFSQLAYEDMTPQKFRTQHGMSPNAELPGIKTEPFRGLMSIVYREDIVQKQWVVVLDPHQAPPNQTTIPLEQPKLIPRYIYDRAIMESDEFLQNCGIGLDIQAEDYMGKQGPGL